ncbi:four helix bundle protein [Candidatus Kaiserbacteria bacterium]|nr:four helix bundle protein [Candidatus Kaiserbacteria bacterium]
MNNDLDIPIFKKSYDLYKTFYSYRIDVSKQDRYTIWQRSENLILDVIEAILLASQSGKAEKLPFLETASVKLNLLRVLIRLTKDVKAIDNKRYIVLETDIDEIGRMLGGWIRSTKER